MDNKYMTLLNAVKEAATRLDEGDLLSDGANDWDIDNLMDELDSAADLVTDDTTYYCVGYDGSVGLTRDNGYNVEWIYRVVRG